MSRSIAAYVGFVGAAGALLSTGSLYGMQEAAAEPVKAKVFLVAGEIDTAAKNRIIAAVNTAAKSGIEKIVFDLQISQKSGFGECLGLARAISQAQGSIKQKVAYIGKPLLGHGVLVALACDEIVMEEGSKLGDAFIETPDAEPLKVELEGYREIASLKGHDPWLVQSMASKELRLFQVRTNAGGKRYLPENKIDEFAGGARIIDRKVVKEAGSRAVYSSRDARELGLVRYVAGSLREAASLYGIPESVAVAESVSDADLRAFVVRIERPVDASIRNTVRRQITNALDQQCNLLFVELDTIDGDAEACENVARDLSEAKIRSVAFVPKRATGAAAMIAFGCKEIVLADGAQFGNIPVRGGDLKRRADALAEIASQGKFPAAFVKRFVDPDVQVFRVRNKKVRNQTAFRTGDELQNPAVAEEWEKAAPGPVVDKGPPLVVGADEAIAMEIAVGKAASLSSLFTQYGVKGDVPVVAAGWVDWLVELLTSDSGTVFLVTTGLLCLYLEVQMPGFILPAVVAGVCFILYFWSRWFSDLAGSLEIVLFLIGVLLLGLELFVIPGFGFIGLAGLATMIFALVLASQSFVVPSSEAEAWSMASSFGRVMAAVCIFSVIAILLARFLPRLPIFERLRLKPAGGGSEGWTFDDADGELRTELVGSRGVASSPLRPAGRVQLGDEFFDVVTQGEFIPPGAAVEVVEVTRSRIVVKAATG
jgi:membrane-bound serine protease (ClpP class)